MQAEAAVGAALAEFAQNVEPPAKKRRNDDYMLMTRPRKQMRTELRRNAVKR
ncbi:MAG: hypothetical protein NTU53_22215 [Planctomycetota bacterium]|nr:hypothetical protein [Planctomycetota bacterium]